MIRVYKLKRNIVLFLTVFAFLLTVISSTPVQADYVTADLGDVIAVYFFMNYQKPGEPKTFWAEKHSMDIYMGPLPIPAAINQTIAETYPDRHDIQLDTVIEPVRNRLVGLRIGEEDEFTVTAEEADITDPEYPLYEADLFYQVKMLEMLYDAKVEPIPELEITDPIVIMSLVILGAAIVGLFYVKVPHKIYKYIIMVGTDKCSVCGEPSDVICGNVKCRSVICRSCFQKHNGCPHCKGVSIQTKK